MRVLAWWSSCVSAVVLLLVVLIPWSAAQAQSPDDEETDWQAAITSLGLGAPIELGLPPLNFGPDNHLDPRDVARLSEVGAILRSFGPGRSAIVFQLEMVTGRSSRADELREVARVNEAYRVLARNAKGASPGIYFMDPPAEPNPLGDMLFARITLRNEADLPAPENPEVPLLPTPIAPERPTPEVLVGLAPDSGPIETMILGTSFELPQVTFRPGTATLTAASAAMLRDLATRTSLLEADRFQLFILPQAAPGLSPDAEVTLERGRFQAIMDELTLGGDTWQGVIRFELYPGKPLALTDSLTVALTLTALPDATAPDWSHTRGAPSDVDALAFGATSPGEDFALTDPRLLTSVEGMIDFWTSPEWTVLNGYDPALFDIGIGTETTLALHMLDNRAGLAVWTGIPDLFLSVPHDFSENRPYHIALLVTPEEMTLMVDGLALSPTIPLPLGNAAPTRIRIGNDASRSAPYVGRIHEVRIWHDIPDAKDLARIREVDFIPDEMDPLAASASSVIWWNWQVERTEMRNLPVIESPDEGWYATLTDGDIRMMNADEFARGAEAPVFSGMQNDWQDTNLSVAARPFDPAEPGAFGAVEDAQNNPDFAVRRAFRIFHDDGVDLDRLQRPPPASFNIKTERTFEWGVPGWGLVIRTDAGGVVAVTQSTCQSAARPHDRWTCPGTLTPGTTMIVFDIDEYITGLSFQKTDKRLRNLKFFTNKRDIFPFGGNPQPGETVVENYFRLLPAGVRPSSFTAYFSTAAGGMVDFGLNFDPRHARSGLTLVTETGEAMRFARNGSSQFVSADGTMGFLAGLPGATSVANPSLFLRDSGRLLIDGVPGDLLLSPDHPATKPGTAFNDTFVSLSKAVNLQANYVGYDAVRMDPLHLTKTGTHHPVFKMPDGDSRDYYDANRIFVPRGLHYFPEFTGKHHASVTTADTYSEYFDSFSDTVSFGIGGKKAPGSFSASATMSGAKKTIGEAKNSRTRALSRALFYDLVLDHQHMQLDDLFADEARLLAGNGRYTAFIETFGTHYPVAVVYGGLGVLEIDATESMREQMRQKGISIKLEASVMLDKASQTSASFGYEHESEHAETFRDVMGTQVENFYWIGGTHAGASNSGWTVGTDGVVPVHVQLRPIWELLSPLYFDDPFTYVLARQGLKDATDRHISAAGRGLPGGVHDDTYVVEMRVDTVSCTTDPANSMREPGQRTIAPGNVQLTGKAVQMFPMVGMVIFGGNGEILRNLVAHEVSETEDYKALRVECPSQLDLMERSPYAAANALFRYQMKADDILSGRASYSVLDRLDLESRVLTPPVDTKSSEVKTKAFLAGLTLGISVLVDEMTNDDGSILVRGAQTVLRPQMAQVGNNLRNNLCPTGQACPTTRADLDRLNGQWIKKSVQIPRTFCPSPALASPVTPFPAFMCHPRRVDYSVRIVK